MVDDNQRVLRFPNRDATVEGPPQWSRSLTDANREAEGARSAFAELVLQDAAIRAHADAIASAYAEAEARTTYHRSRGLRRFFGGFSGAALVGGGLILLFGLSRKG